MKGVILAAGKGTRLYPLTEVIPKVLLPVYDKPMIYYALEFLVAAGVKEVLVITSQSNDVLIRDALGSGEKFEVEIDYVIQKEVNGTGGAFKLAKNFISHDDSILIYGDNVLFGDQIDKVILDGLKNLKSGFSSIVTNKVRDARKYGVVGIDRKDIVASIEEKPNLPKSNMISTGIYFFTSDVVDRFDFIKLSVRGEYEITDVLNSYISEKRLKAVKLKSRLWFDAGDYDTLLSASQARKKIVNKKQKGL